jgi:hypothetical protein
MNEGLLLRQGVMAMFFEAQEGETLRQGRDEIAVERIAGFCFHTIVALPF